MIPKYNIGDIVYVADYGKVRRFVVCEIRIERRGMFYELSVGIGTSYEKEENLFSDFNDAKECLISKEIEDHELRLNRYYALEEQDCDGYEEAPEFRENFIGKVGDS